MIETLIPVPGRLKPIQSGVQLAYASDIYDDVHEKKLSQTLLSINGVIPIIPAYEYRSGLYRPIINGKLADEYDPASPDFEESEINGNSVNYYNTVFVVPAININGNPDWNNLTYYIYNDGWREKTSFERGKIYINIDTYKLYTGDTQNQLVQNCVTAEDLQYDFNQLYSYCENLDSRLQALEEDEISSISWSGGSINPSTVSVGGTATLTKGTVVATYTSGRTEDVTDRAEFVTNGDGYIDGTTYHPRSTAGPEDIFPRYGGKSATNPIMVIVIEQTYTISLTVIHGTKSPDSNLVVNAGGSGGWTIEPEDGYQLPIGVVGAELIGNIVNVTNVQADNTYIAECQPVESHLAVQFGHGTSYNDAEWVTVGQLTDNLSVRNISNTYGEYLFIKYDKRDTVNNLWIDSDIPSSIDLDEPIVDGDYKYRRSEIRGASLAPIDYIINKV